MTEKIKIGAVDFALEFVERLRDPESVQSLAGNIRYTYPQISIDTEQDEQRKYLVLWHEIFHGISDAMQIDLDENDIDKLARGFVQTQRDNRETLDKYYPKDWL